ncbi:MAG: hypothetical protein GYA46_02450 [candidate division Zixibacteria bacterium]|nr:hypothetical protein [candidate division Zixibacteria bacterium]
MPKRKGFILSMVAALAAMTAALAGAAMQFDQTQWQTGDMNEQSPADSAGTVGTSNVDYFYYYERIPMRMPALNDSLAAGSAGRRYDSAVLAIIVSQNGAAGNDSMRIFARRLIRNWSENGASWNYYWASSDSGWSSPGGDITAERCSDTVMIDAAVAAVDTLIFHLDTGFVRSMIETANFGWLLMAANVVDRFPFQVYTEDCTNPAFRPFLTVFYTESAPPAAGHRRRIALGGRP